VLIALAPESEGRTRNPTANIASQPRRDANLASPRSDNHGDRAGRRLWTFGAPGMRQRLPAFLSTVRVVYVTLPRKRSVWAVRAALATPCSWFAARMSLISGHRGAYYPDSLPLAFHYPLAAVTLSTVLMTVEVVTMDVVLNRGRFRPVWTRAAPAAVVALPISYFAAASSMHAPPYVGIHQIWLVVLNAVLAVLAITSGLIHAIRFALVRWYPAINGGHRKKP